MRPDAAAKRDTFFAAIGSRSLLMGIVNVTPDSFSDGGRFVAPEAAIAQARAHVAASAAIIDVGAESTRPGYTPVSEAEELARLEPALTALIASVDVAVSIDTTKAGVARVALAAGAAVVNDQWGLQRDPAMAVVVAEGEAGLVIMHNRDDIDAAIDIMDDMRRFFDRSLALADRAGIPHHRIILDPGIGFGKSKAQNLAALHGIAALRGYGLPVLVGVSRKSLFAALIGATDVADRLIGTLAANLAAAARGAAIFRVHDCAENRAALTVFDAIERA
ncbi:dihydropteroate synthase [Beijerinckia sp. L45]|uniref:dihydropteroate synthase n=1 Tax=Beijerinckia sp. L45 TaxID=1641855 RepID=UPI001AED2FD0|nr:dihydropteroate synthase [Beijerinckia sp. L45]